ncbi:MAG: beta-N-acetylglucosaminidase domain-containing protein [Candidatus Latescibacterota bacterium]
MVRRPDRAFLRIIIIAAFTAALTAHAQRSLLENPGFESGAGNSPAFWELRGDSVWETGMAHSGKRAVSVRSSGKGSPGVATGMIPVPGDAFLSFSAWVKVQGVERGKESWHQMRCVVTQFNANRERIKHLDMITYTGSIDWSRWERSFIVDTACRYITLSFVLSECAGALWADDVELSIAREVPKVNSAGIEPPVLLPQPWYSRLHREKLPLEGFTFRTAADDTALRRAVEEYGASLGIPCRSGSRANSGASLLFGERNDKDLAAHFRKAFPGVTWAALGEQGYFLTAGRENGRTVIRIGANSIWGRAYAFQTLRQLVNPEDRIMYAAEIADFPTLSHRGITHGMHLFNQEETFRRMEELKLTYSWVQGLYVREKLSYRWREPFTDEDRAEIRSHVAKARAHFVREPYITFLPRGRDASGATTYSSDRDIGTLAGKMFDLYASCGARHFAVSFDDLHNTGQDRLFGPDIEKFKDDMGRAHLYFSSEVYKRLKVRCPDISFIVLAMPYWNPGSPGELRKRYYAAMRDLPPEVGLMCSPETVHDAEFVLRSSGRPARFWDNFYAEYYGGSGTKVAEYVVPLDRPRQFNDRILGGYSLLPLLFAQEDSARVSWRTMGDYAWSPERYNPEVSFQLAAALHRGARDTPDPAKPSVATPVIMPLGGSSGKAVRVIMKTAASGADIRYTSDGSFPTAQSTVYTGPFMVKDSARVRARALGEGWNPSGVVSAFYGVEKER